MGHYKVPLFNEIFLEVKFNHIDYKLFISSLLYNTL